MRPKLYVSLATISVLYSCCKTQYLTVSSHQARRDEKKGLIVENDTIRLVCSFNFARSWLTVSLYNKFVLPIRSIGGNQDLLWTKRPPINVPRVVHGGHCNN